MAASGSDGADLAGDADRGEATCQAAYRWQIDGPPGSVAGGREVAGSVAVYQPGGSGVARG